ncbi:cholinesterase 1-like [Acanthaster planci]|uniref:Carboxylic ester hydrolase n=1 Tax=Acanthaster planci TaxID=133434 RepID=A0A8B7Z0P7_ACAPL|nr:cholinesterase 1-like [Acanthaster planci]
MSGQPSVMFLLGSTLIALGLLVTLTTSQPTVTVTQGTLVGTTETFLDGGFSGAGNKKVNVFKGIPFAEPPLGSLRLKPPVEKASWEDEVYNATYFRPGCLQDPFYAQTLDFDIDEDCLHLNVFAPNATLSEPVPVMVWIHGGGFTFGSAIERVYNGVPLAAVGDVIVVTVNYRLGVMGFLSTADEASPGNLASLDNVLALKWIQENIEAFGGDKERVTIFGESAGGVMVAFLVLSEMTEGLFTQAIVQSGSAFSVEVGPLTEKGDMVLRQKAFQLGEVVGCSPSDSSALISCLQAVNADDLINAQAMVYGRMYPVVDGTFLKMTPAEAYASGNYNRVKMLLGSNTDEGTLNFLFTPGFEDYRNSKTPPPVNRTVFELLLATQFYTFDVYDETVLDAVRMKYIDWSQAEYVDADYFRTMVNLVGDWLFSCTVDKLAHEHAKENEVFLYQLAHRPTVSYYSFQGVNPGWLGAAHAEDLPFVFGAAFVPESPSSNLTDEEKTFTVKVMKLWTNFAKSGNPGLESPGSQPISDEYAWPLYSSPDLKYKVLDLNLTTSRALKSDECYFWNTYVVQLRSALGELDDVERQWRQAFKTWKYTDMADWRDEFNKYKAVVYN